MANETTKKIQMWTPSVQADTYWTPYSSNNLGTFTSKEYAVEKPIIASVTSVPYQASSFPIINPYEEVKSEKS